MKKFVFPLDRVLAWRQAQARLEEAGLSRLHQEVQALDLRHAALDQAVLEASGRLLAAPSATAAELGAMEHFRSSVSAQTRFLQKTRLTLEQRIARQTQTLVERRREAQLLDSLRERRLQEWQKAAVRELEQQADESFLARLNRSARMQ
jgi:flagellar export protein FliJ